MKTLSLTKSQQMSKVIDGLAHFLADSYILYLKTQNCHWNVTGINFHSLHEMFEEQYIDLQGAVDEIAERIRALQAHAPASFAQFSKLTTLDEIKGELSAEEMLKTLLADHETVIKHGKELFKICEDVGDDVTGDLMLKRLAVHQKNAWMIRSTLE